MNRQEHAALTRRLIPRADYEPGCPCCARGVAHGVHANPYAECACLGRCTFELPSLANQRPGKP